MRTDLNCSPILSDDAEHPVIVEHAELADFDSPGAEQFKRDRAAWNEARARLAEVPAGADHDLLRETRERALARCGRTLGDHAPIYAGALRGHLRRQAALRGDDKALRQEDEYLERADAERAELAAFLVREGRDEPGAVRMVAAIDQERAAIHDRRELLSLVRRFYGRRRRIPGARMAGRRLRKRLFRRERGTRSPPDDPSRPQADPADGTGPAARPSRDDTHTGGDDR